MIPVNRLRPAGKDVETIVRELVSEQLADEDDAPAKAASHEEFMAKLRAIIELHPGSGGSMDDSRESIYAGRGE